MQVFDRGTIENFSENISEETINEAFRNAEFIINNAITDIRKRNAYLQEDFEIIPINEFFSGAITSVSSLDILLSIKSSQIEFNTVKLIKNKGKALLERLKEAWRNRNSKKPKKKDKYIKKHGNNTNVYVDQNLYSMTSFQKDLVNTIANYIPPTSIVFLKNGILHISGEKQAFQIRIFTVINKQQTYNFYLYSKNKFFNLDFKFREENIKLSLEKYGDDYLSLIKIFTLIYFNIYQKAPNSLVLESIMANLPEDIINSESIYDKFVYAINYLINTNIYKNITSILDGNTKLTQDKICDISYSELKKMIEDIAKYTKSTPQ